MLLEGTRPPSPALSVVVPTRNSRELSLRCLASLPGRPDLEVLVVDDASEDGTAAAVAERFPGALVLRSGERRGFTGAANDGLGRARGEILLLLNSDTRLDPGAVEALLAAFERDPRLGIAGGELRFPDGSPQWSGGREPDLVWLFALASGIPALLGRLPGYRRLRPPSGGAGPLAWVTGAALALRRQVWLDCGPLDGTFLFYGQDLDLCLRAGRRGWGVAVVPGFSLVHLQGATLATEEGGGGGAGSPRGFQHHELLWTDLLRWAEKERGSLWARRAAGAMGAGARLRLAGRAAAALAVPRGRRAAFRAETESLRQALAALRADGA